MSGRKKENIVSRDYSYGSKKEKSKKNSNPQTQEALTKE